LTDIYWRADASVELSDVLNAQNKICEFIMGLTGFIYIRVCAEYYSKNCGMNFVCYKS